MRRSLYVAQHRMNPTTTEKLPEDSRSCDTLPDPTFETPLFEHEDGSVQNGLSFKAPLYEGQYKYPDKKVYDCD